VVQPDREFRSSSPRCPPVRHFWANGKVWPFFLVGLATRPRKAMLARSWDD
jgi:hypothetical protein